MEIDFTEIILLAASGILTTVFTYLTYYLKNKWKIEIEAKHREALTQAILNGIEAALHKHPLTVEMKPTIASQALDYVVRQTPDAVNHFAKNNPNHSLERVITTMLDANYPVTESKINE